MRSNRGLLAASAGDPGAAALLRRRLTLHRELRDRWRMCSVLDDLAAVALAGGEEAAAEQAAGLLGAAEATREAIGTVIAPCERAQHDETRPARAALGAAAFAAAWQRVGWLRRTSWRRLPVPAGAGPGAGRT